ncbi:MAG: prohibitin family protein [Myxococcota bacterium]|jgi:regulator of protease activity HflC (stomatin/prohibitin superfamily)|nr:prohibitin family protein [Myxococcota bacterium]
MSNNSIIAIAVVLFLVMFAPRVVKIVPPGHVSVSDFFGNVNPEPKPAGAHVVNPLLRWHNFDVRENTHKESAQVPTRDQLQTKVDVSIQWRINPAMAAKVFMEVGTREQAVAVYLVPKVRSLVRELGTAIAKAEDFFQEETRRKLEASLREGLVSYLTPLGIDVKAVLIRDINLPPVLTKAIEQKKEREQAVERQKAELERFRTEQQQQVAAAEAKKQSAEQEAEQIRVLAKARADEIRLINDAVARNPAYIQLQALEALKSMAKDPAAKIYFMDSDAQQPLPLMHMGERPN